MAIEKIYTMAEMLESYRSKISSSGLDSFRIRVNRRPAAHLAPDYLATFEEVSISQILSPELWIIDLFGGGHFEITVNHASDPNGGMPGPYKISYDPAQNPLKKATYETIVAQMGTPGWMGPTHLLYPRPPSAQMTPGPVTTTVGPPAPVAPPASTNSVGNPQLNQIATGSQNPAERNEANRLQYVSEKLAEQERKNFEDKLELKIAAMAPKEKQGPSILELMTAAAPFLIQFMNSKAATEERMFKAQQESAAMQLQLAKDAANQQMTLMTALMNRPKDDSAKAMGDMIGTMSNVLMQTMHAQAELMNAGAPQQESPAFKLARQAMVTLSAFMGKGQAQMLPDEDGQIALPPGTEAPQAQNGEKQKFSQLELLARAFMRHDPKEKVAERFIKALKSKKFNQVLHTKYQGNFLALVNDVLGPWAAESAENMEYAQETVPFIWEAATKVMPHLQAAPVPAKPAPEPPLETIAPSNGAHPDQPQEPAEATPPERPSRKNKAAQPPAA